MSAEMITAPVFSANSNSVASSAAARPSWATWSASCPASSSRLASLGERFSSTTDLTQIDGLSAPVP